MSKVKSPRGSLKGWELKKWLKGNFKTLKELAKVGLPFFFGLFVTGRDPALTTLITGFGKLAFDALEYWLKEY